MPRQERTRHSQHTLIRFYALSFPLLQKMHENCAGAKGVLFEV